MSLVLLLALAFAGQEPNEVPDFSDEGPIRNSTFLPTSSEAQAEIQRGDRSYAVAIKTSRNRTEAFDAWHSALEISSPGDAVLLADRGELGLWADPDHTHERRSEGVAYAVRRRLALLSAQDQVAWTMRFEPVAEGALASAGTDPDRLARVERDHPRTQAAAQAALLLADLALERGELDACRVWMERSSRAARASAAGEGLTRALEARGQAVHALDKQPAPNDPWRNASEWTEIGGIRLEGKRPPGTRATRTLGLGLEPGLAFLADESIVVQTAKNLVRIQRGGELARFKLAEVVGLEYPAPFASSSGGWWLGPAARGNDVFLVIGRARPTEGNILACIGFDTNGVPFTRWSLSKEGRKVGEAKYVPHLDDLGSGSWSFQPGPTVFENTVFVQARQLPTEEGNADGASERIYLCAFDGSDGSLLWKRFLTKAADLRSDIGGRMRGSSGRTSPGQPLAVHAGYVFVGTNVGLAALVDATDGRLVWSFRSRRRDAGEGAGWPGSRPPIFVTGFAAGDDGTSSVAWAPFDSDFLYNLRAGPDRGQGLYVSPPRPIGEAQILLSAENGGDTLFLGRAGPRATLTARDADWQRRDSLYLARGERFSGFGLVSESRVLAASDRSLFVFDKGRDLYLTTVLPLPDLGSGRGGSVYARGGRVYVVGWDSMWTFQVAR